MSDSKHNLWQFVPQMASDLDSSHHRLLNVALLSPRKIEDKKSAGLSDLRSD